MPTAEKPESVTSASPESNSPGEPRRMPVEEPSAWTPAPDCVLCVDLDGALVKSDTLFDGACLFARRRPSQLWRLPVWLAAGRARLKAEIARHAPLDVTRLPYNSALLRFLRAERRAGRAIQLATGADISLAGRVAAHLGIFDGVLASDGVTNLTREKKLARIESRFGSFDYVGNSTADLPLLMRARLAMAANPTRGLVNALRMRGVPVARTFLDQPSRLGTVLKAIRLHQWAKNILLLAPLLFSHNLRPRPAADVFVAFFCFCFMASANYLVNDLLDLENDRRHPAKRFRPFASGDLPVSSGILLAMALACTSLALLPFLPRAFAMWLGIYLLATSAYSIYLKRIAIVDVLVLSGLYTLRLLAGGAATATTISPWLAGFSSFLFLSLAMVKRFSELENLRERGGTVTHGRGYRVADLEQIRAFGTASAYAAVLVFTLYITRPDVDALYKHPARLWLIVPLMVYWITRVWLIASRGELDDDPVIFALRDRISLAIGLCVVAVAIVAL